MQRLAEKIYREFSLSCKYVEIHVLDGNGDNFQVYQGHVNDISSHIFTHVLRDPGCFYFFQVTSVSDLISSSPTPESTIIRRDLCWLTDPSPPTLQGVSANAITVNWDPARFCGIHPPSKVDSIQYSIDIAEGIEWKDGAMSKYITDAMVAPSSYRTVFRAGAHETSCTIPHLKAATWYHIRLSIEYLGVRVTSEALNIPTGRSAPEPPSVPRATLVPIPSSFDLKSIVPARYEFLITWNTAACNGSPIDRYQVQLQRLDAYRQVINEEPPVTTLMRPSTSHNSTEGGGQLSLSLMNESKAIAILTNPTNRKSNQWIGSPGRSEAQIRNSLHSRGRPTTLEELRPSRSQKKRRSPSPPERSSSPVQPTQDGNPLENSPHLGIWRVIYDNLNRSVRLVSPKPTDALWLIRVRARNREGWSVFSPILELSWKTHPTLFTCRPAQFLSSGSLTSRPNNAIGTNSPSTPIGGSSPLASSRGAIRDEDDRFATARTEETLGSQRSYNSNAGTSNENGTYRPFVSLTPLQLKENPSFSQQATPLQNAPSTSKQGTARDETMGSSHNNDFIGGILPSISADYEHLVEKNASSTSLMLEHSNHTVATPTTMMLQQHRIQQLQDHILHPPGPSPQNHSQGQVVSLPDIHHH